MNQLLLCLSVNVVFLVSKKSESENIALAKECLNRVLLRANSPKDNCLAEQRNFMVGPNK